MEGSVMPDETKTILTDRKVTAAVSKKAEEEILQRIELLDQNSWNRIIEKYFYFGKPALEYIKYQDKIKLFIEANKIRPLESVKPIKERVWPHGGMFVEFRHVHIDNNIYLLNDVQFNALDKEMIKEFKISLKNAGEVKF
jgi:hypothetical protein